MFYPAQKEEQILLYIIIGEKPYVVLFVDEVGVQDNLHLFQYQRGGDQFCQYYSNERSQFHGLVLFFQRFVDPKYKFEFKQRDCFDDKSTHSKTFIVQMHCPEGFSLGELEKSFEFRSFLPEGSSEQESEEGRAKQYQRVEYIDHDPIPRACFPKFAIKLIPLDKLEPLQTDNTKLVIRYNGAVIRNGIVRPICYVKGVKIHEEPEKPPEVSANSYVAPERRHEEQRDSPPQQSLSPFTRLSRLFNGS